jgi:hypothetical protein
LPPCLLSRRVEATYLPRAARRLCAAVRIPARHTSLIGLRPITSRAAEQHFDAVVVGSSWNAQILKQKGLRVPIHTGTPLVRALEGCAGVAIHTLPTPKHSLPACRCPSHLHITRSRAHEPTQPIHSLSHAVPRVPTRAYAVLQGVDPLLFHPRQRPGAPLSPPPSLATHTDGRAPKSRMVLGVEVGGGGVIARPPQLRDRFVVFSGGKFELRKAPDVVVGVRRFSPSLVHEA